jgi:hypothetical protein
LNLLFWAFEFEEKKMISIKTFIEWLSSIPDEEQDLARKIMNDFLEISKEKNLPWNESVNLFIHRHSSWDNENRSEEETLSQPPRKLVRNNVIAPAEDLEDHVDEDNGSINPDWENVINKRLGPKLLNPAAKKARSSSADENKSRVDDDREKGNLNLILENICNRGQIRVPVNRPTPPPIDESESENELAPAPLTQSQPVIKFRAPGYRPPVVVVEDNDIEPSQKPVPIQSLVTPLPPIITAGKLFLTLAHRRKAVEAFRSMDEQIGSPLMVEDEQAILEVNLIQGAQAQGIN